MYENIYIFIFEGYKKRFLGGDAKGKQLLDERFN